MLHRHSRHDLFKRTTHELYEFTVELWHRRKPLYGEFPSTTRPHARSGGCYSRPQTPMRYCATRHGHKLATRGRPPASQAAGRMTNGLLRCYCNCRFTFSSPALTQLLVVAWRAGDGKAKEVSSNEASRPRCR